MTPAPPFEVFFDLVPNGAVLYAPVLNARDEVVDFRFVRLNPAGQRLLGLPAHPTRTFRELYPHSVATGVFAQYRAAYLTGHACSYDVPSEQDGFDAVFHVTAQRSGELLVVSFTGPAAPSFLPVEQALREARAEAERLQRERETFNQVFALTPAAICIQRGPEHRYEYANAAYLQFFPGRQIVGQTVAEALPETVESGVVALLDRVYQTGETYYGEELPLLIAQPEGPPQWMYFTFTYQALRENGEIVGISTFAYNVAEQVYARRQRELQQLQLHALFEQAPVAIAIFRGPQYVIELANPAVCALWGRTPQQAVGTPLFELLPEAAGQGFEQLLDGVMATGTPCVATELPSFIHREGRRDVVYWNFVYQPLRNAEEHITGVTVVATEVSEQVQARQQVQGLNQELQAANAELRETNRQLTRTNVDLDTFVYTASHDLKAPITNIESIVLALRDVLPAEVQQGELVAHLLNLLNQTVVRFQGTIAQLTDITKLQLAHAGPAEAVPLAQLVAEVRQDLAPVVHAAATHLQVAIAPDLVVSFSPANLRSIVYNLLSNAVKYRDPARPSVVRVAAQATPAGVVLTVEDNGLGMSELQRRQLFGLFQRLHTHVEGTGVGLYIVKRLVENVGGTIAVQSQPNVGTTFTVTFPQ